MKAITQDEYGTADALEFSDIAQPAIRDDEVLLRVHAAGLDAGVWHLMTGLPYMVRMMGYGLRKPKSPVLGMDVAGTVESVGKKVTQLRPGDEVYGTARGSFAEYAVSKEKKLAPKPANLSFEQAASVPISATTALNALRDKGRVRAGQKVLVIGASGGVGSFAMQMAKAFGAEVTGVCRTNKMDFVRSLGAHDVIDYTRGDFADGARRWDLIIDTGGNRKLSHLQRALTPRGTLVIVGGEGGGRWTGGFGRSFRAPLRSFFTRQRLTMLIAPDRREDLVTLTELLEAGKITPAIDRTYPLIEAPEAIRYWEAGKARGKVVITA